MDFVKLLRRQFLQLAGAAVAGSALPQLASALDYPTRPVRIIVGFPAGNASDIIVRLMAQSLSERFGQQFVVENRPGAGSTIGTGVVVRAQPDGYTLLMEVMTANAINASLYTHPPNQRQGRLIDGLRVRRSLDVYSPTPWPSRYYGRRQD
jgi:tripartite-type tricarboxylate transporter receptor subunit TctC